MVKVKEGGSALSVFLSIIFLFALPLQANDDDNATFLDRWLIQPRDYLSDTVIEISHDMDTFFSGQYSEDENKNKSYFRAESGVTFIDGGEIRENFDFTARIRLPRTERYFYFEIETFEDSEDPNAEVGDRGGEGTVQDPAEDVTAAFRFLLRTTKTLSLQANLGVKMGAPAEAFGRLRGRYSTVVYKWEHRFEEDVYYFSLSGWENSFRYTLSRIYTKQFLVKVYNALIYKHEQESYGLNNSISLNYQHNHDHGWLLFTGMNSQRYATEPFRATGYFAGLRYRQKVIKSWLLIDVEPQYRWPKEEAFRPVPQIKFNLTLYIGYS